jgi:hypothetical protein
MFDQVGAWGSAVTGRVDRTGDVPGWDVRLLVRACVRGPARRLTQG